VSDNPVRYVNVCQAGCGAQMVVPATDIVRADGAFRCPQCGKAYDLTQENLRDLAAVLAANRRGHAVRWLEEHPEKWAREVAL
jgi:hypothetical protein